MKVVIAAVGRMKSGPEKTLVDTYLKRLPWSVDVWEIDHKKNAKPSAIVQSETESLLKCVPSGAPVICLDSRGKSITSEALASRVRDWRDDGAANLAFLIGGPDGLAQSSLKAADLVLSFGQATWPHMMVRAMLMEQLYRAHCILTDHPYHRGH